MLLGVIEAQQVLRLLDSGDSETVLLRIASGIGVATTENDLAAVRRLLRQSAQERLQIFGGRQLWREGARAKVQELDLQNDSVAWSLYGLLPSTEEDAAIFGRAMNASTFRGRHFQLSYLGGYLRDMANSGTSRGLAEPDGRQDRSVQPSLDEDSGMAP